MQRVRDRLRAARHPVAPPSSARPRDGTRVRVAGVVTHRQRPATASGVTFINLEDETGMANIVITVRRAGTATPGRPRTPPP